MGTEWLWDRKTTDEESKTILADEHHHRFVELSSVLLSRHNNPKEIFSVYLDRAVFVRQWPAIKRMMRRNAWSDPRIIFWQAVYEKLREQFQSQGMVFPRQVSQPGPAIAVEAGEMVRQLREGAKLTQAELARRIGISQQVISRVEKGKGNTSLMTLERISSALGKRMRFYPATEEHIL